MQTKNQISLTRKSLYVIILLAIFLSAFSTGNFPVARAQETEGLISTYQAAYKGMLLGQDICMVDGTVRVSTEETEAIKSAVANATMELNFNNAECFAVIDLRDEGEWHLLTLVGVVGVQDGSNWNVVDNGVWSDLVIVHFLDSSIEAAIAGTVYFSELLSQIPENIFSEEAKNALDPLVEQVVGLNALETYIFPFENGRLIKYFRFHFDTSENYTFWTGTNSKSVDLGSDGNTGANHAPNRLIAVASGWVRQRCSQKGSYSSTYIAVENDDGNKIIYAHIIKSGAPSSGTRISQGQDIGTLKIGNFSDGVCGHGSQEPSEFHIHFEVPNTSSLTLSDWTLNTSTGVWTRGSETWTSGQYKQIGSGGGGTGQDCGQVSYNGVVLYEQATCNKDQSGRTKTFSSSTGQTDIVSDFNDITSSIYVKPGWSIKVFEKSVGEGGGSWRCIAGSMWDLNVDYYTNGDTGRKINNDISSVQVYGNNNNCGSGGSLKTGDANGDGKVDGIDYVIWAIHYNQTTTAGPSVGDFNNDHKVDGIDYVLWAINYGK